MPDTIVIPETIDALLKCAKEKVEALGLAKHVLQDPYEGSVCIRGAFFLCLSGHTGEEDDRLPTDWTLWSNMPGYQMWRETEAAIVEACPDVMRRGSGYSMRDQLVNYNNAQETTKEDILGVLERTLAHIS